jgi:hemerythrin superfamily protein
MASRSPSKQSTSRPASARSKPSNALALLTQEHRDVEGLFTTFEGLGARAHKRRRQVVDKVIVALSQHAAIEETVFYPAVRAQARALDGDVLEALEEHHVVKWTLSELESLPAEDERFVAKMTVLMESVRHHVKEEEKDLFPSVRKAFTRAELDELGAALRAAKASAPTRPHPRAPDTPPGNVIATALTAPLDAAANLAGAAAKRVRDVVS